MLYSLGETGSDVRLSVIEVFDLGFFGNEFTHKTTITMLQLVEARDNIYGIKPDKSMTRQERAALHNIVDI